MTVHRVARRPLDPQESARASRLWWEHAADEYQAEHGDFLGAAEFVWGPEGLTEQEAQLLGSPAELAGRRILEIGCGAGQCGRWLRAHGVAEVVGIDMSARQLQHSHRLDQATGHTLPVVQADAQRLPFADASFDVVCSSFGAFPFIPDIRTALAEAARVLRPGGRLAFSVSHPIRWCFPDSPGEEGLQARDSYFDRRPYVEEDERGRALYVEAHTRSATGCVPSPVLGSCSATSSNLNGRRTTTRSGAGGARCGAASSPAQRFSLPIALSPWPVCRLQRSG